MSEPRITVIGLDGSPPSRQSAALLAQVSLVIASDRHRLLLGEHLPVGARFLSYAAGVGSAVDAAVAHQDAVAVLASGDPGFFGIVRLLAERVPTRLDVVPAVSSVAQAFARVGLAWDDALVVSAHGRPLRQAVNVALAHPKVAVLTAPGQGAAELGEALRGSGRHLIVAECLGAEGERVSRVTPEQAATESWAEPHVVLVLDAERVAAGPGWCFPPPKRPEDGWALPETAFAHRDGMVTKAEVRALVLARLGPAPGRLVWDIGAGSGSVAIECARLGAAAVAVERDPIAVALLRDNLARHQVDVRVVAANAPEALALLPAPDAVFVGGGGLGVLDAVAAFGFPVLVTAIAVVERVGPALQAFSRHDYRTEAVLLSAARLIPLADGHRLAPENPITVITGRRP